MGSRAPAMLVLGLVAVLALSLNVMGPAALATGAPYVMGVGLAAFLLGGRGAVAMAAVCTACVILEWMLGAEAASPTAIASILTRRSLELAAAWALAGWAFWRPPAQQTRPRREVRAAPQDLPAAVSETRPALTVSSDSPDLTNADATRHFFDLSLDMLCTANLDGHFTAVNPAFTRTLGFSREALLSQPFLEFVHPDDRKATLEVLEQLGQGGDAVHFENRYRCSDGSYRWLQWSTPAARPGEEIVYAVARDVTEQKRAELELQRLSTIVACSQDAIIAGAPDGAITSWNQGAEALYGYTAEEAIGQHVSLIVTPDRRDETEYHLNKLARGEQITSYDTVRVRKDGRRVDVSLTLSPIRDRHGEYLGAASIARDISERKRAERRLQLTIEASPTALVMVDQDGRILLANSQAERVFGYGRQELVGLSAETLIPSELRHRLANRNESVFSALQRRATGAAIDLVGLRRDGGQFPLEISLNPIETDDGPAVIAGLTDLTRRQQVLETLKEARHAAESANRAKSAFLANMSHEIRTPMNAILGMTELVLDTPLADDQRDYLKTARDSAEVLLTLLDDVLDFSKIEAGKMDLEVAPFRLRRLVGDSVRSFAVRASQRNLELVWRVANDAPDHLLGDAVRLRQVLLNLLGNSVKFTERGEVSLEVKLLREAEGRIWLEFVVRDTGVGISAEQQQRIFDPFEQADVSTTRRYGGTGLGLPISRRLVDLMGGELRLASQEGQGSEFSFQARFQPGPVDQSEAEETRLDQVRILLVDDHPSSRRVLTEILQQRGALVAEAADGAAALRAFGQARAEERFDVLISDVQMPQMNGYELVASVRRSAGGGSLAVVLLSGDGVGEDRARHSELRIAARLLKPVFPEELARTVATVLGRAVPVARTPAAQKSEPRRTGPLRFLLAEDGIANQKLALGLLKKWGHSATTVTNGRQAVDVIFSGEPFDAVLMDVQMPILDGLDATRAIRAWETQVGGRIPIIAMTAHALKGDRERCLEAGMDGYVSKPVRPRELQSELIRCCGIVADLEPSETASRSGSAGRSVDWDRALKAVAGDHQLLVEVAEAAATECAERLRQLIEAVEAKDAPAVRHAAHALKGTLRIWNAAEITEVAQSLESFAERGDLEGAEQRMAVIQDLVPGILDELTQFVAESPPLRTTSEP